MKTVTEVKVVFTVFEIPLRSIPSFSEFAHPKAKHILDNGSIKASKNPSIILINNNIEPFVTTAVDIFPLIVKSVTIIGKNVFITLLRSFICCAALFISAEHMPITESAMHRVEHMENTILTLLSFKDELKVLKTEITTINSSIEAKLLITSSMPDRR